MNTFDIKRLALILSLNAEIEGMKCENNEKIAQGNLLVYNQQHFKEKAEELSHLAYCHDEQL